MIIFITKYNIYNITQCGISLHFCDDEQLQGRNFISDKIILISNKISLDEVRKNKLLLWLPDNFMRKEMIKAVLYSCVDDVYIINNIIFDSANFYDRILNYNCKNNNDFMIVKTIKNIDIHVRNLSCIIHDATYMKRIFNIPSLISIANKSDILIIDDNVILKKPSIIKYIVINNISKKYTIEIDKFSYIKIIVLSDNSINNIVTLNAVRIDSDKTNYNIIIDDNDNTNKELYYFSTIVCNVKNSVLIENANSISLLPLCTNKYKPLLDDDVKEKYCNNNCIVSINSNPKYSDLYIKNYGFICLSNSYKKIYYKSGLLLMNNVEFYTSTYINSNYKFCNLDILIDVENLYMKKKSNIGIIQIVNINNINLTKCKIKILNAEIVNFASNICDNNIFGYVRNTTMSTNIECMKIIKNINYELYYDENIFDMSNSFNQSDILNEYIQPIPRAIIKFYVDTIYINNYYAPDEFIFNNNIFNSRMKIIISRTKDYPLSLINISNIKNNIIELTINCYRVDKLVLDNIENIKTTRINIDKIYVIMYNNVSIRDGYIGEPY